MTANDDGVFRFPTPAEADQERANILEPKITELRTLVHAHLVKPTDHREIWVPLKAMPMGAVEIVRRELTKAGWNSRYQSDQHDGSSLVVWAQRGTQDR